MTEIILLILLGFVLLIVGADLLVKGASNIAKMFHIPELIIGLTIVSIGTSLPELIITINSAIKEATDLIIGNAIGSNICNLLLILGLTAIINPVMISKEIRNIHLPVALFSELVILGLGIGILGSANNIINRTDGIILLICYLIYFSYPIIIEIKDIIKIEKEEKNNKIKDILLSILYVFLGIVMLKVGGDFVVEKSTEIAILFGVSERVIGLTIVAIGTALPELITSVISAIKKDTDLAVGNLIGSCILNLFLILGLGSIITPLAFQEGFIENLILLIVSTVIICLFVFMKEKGKITRIQGGILVYLFIIYIVKLFITV